MKGDLAWVWLFALIMVRVSGLLLVAPVLAGQYVPKKVRVFFAVVFAILLCGTFSANELPRFDTRMLPLTLSFELLIGLIIGLAFRWTMFGVAVAGEMIGLKMGLGIASVIDPGSGMQSNFVQALFLLLYSVLFVSLDGHHEMLRAFRASYLAIAPGPANLDLSCMPAVIDQTVAMFIVGVRLAGMLLIPLVLVMCAMALMARAFPQANVFFLSYSVSLLVGLFLMSTTGPAIRLAVNHGIQQGTEDALKWIQGLAGM